MPSLPAELADLGHPDLCRFVIRHERRSSFRWTGLVELAVWVCLLLVLGPLLIVLLSLLPVAALLTVGPLAARFALVAGSVLGVAGSVEGPFRLLKQVLFVKRRHVLVIEGRRNDGSSLVETRFEPDVATADTLVGQVLDLAATRGLIAVETLGGDVSECAEVWYGGRALLARPGRPTLAASLDALVASGFVVEDAGDRILLSRTGPVRGRLAGATWLLSIGLVVPLRVLLRAPWWRDLKYAVLDAVGIAPERWCIEIRPDGIEAWEERAAGVAWRESVHGILGVTWSPSLGWDRLVQRRRCALRILGRNSTAVLSPSCTGPRGSALGEALVSAILELRRRAPHLGLPTDGSSPSRCPYCGAVFAMDIGVSCPSCGAWPEAVRA